MKRVIVCQFVVFCMVSASYAAIYNFNGYQVDVDAWAGSGDNEVILVVDWNGVDYGAATVSQSHAFGFRWNGQATQFTMLTAFEDAGIFTFNYADYGVYFLNNVVYDDPDETAGPHYHPQTGSWGLASSFDPYARWGSYDDSDWNFNAGGFNQELLVNGQFVGINAFMYYGTPPEGADESYQLDVPIIPEPATLALLGIGAVLMRKKQ
jgi:hypothetical protein